MSVHPRACGEHPTSLAHFTREYGSSPRLRGTFRIQMAQSPVTRFIPACAGNIHRGDIIAVEWTVHPRVCGEQALDTRMIRARFIPACAGNMPWKRTTLSRFGVHPRCAGNIDDQIRFIPACAGNIRLDKSHLDLKPVHPRACGEHWIARDGATGRAAPVHPRVCGEHI